MNILKDNSKIWRYMDFTKFISMISNKALYFCRADKFEDNYEGLLPDENLKKIKEKYGKEIYENTRDFTKSLKIFTFINCWHINEFESTAMWDLYGNSTETIAIQTDLLLLKESLKKEIEIQPIEYIDFTKDKINENLIYSPYLYKRKSFEHEKELRLIYQDENFIHKVILCMKNSKNFTFSENNDIPKIIPIEIELEKLIKTIYIHPKAQSWFYELVKKILSDYNLNIEIKQSNLYESIY